MPVTRVRATIYGIGAAVLAVSLAVSVRAYAAVPQSPKGWSREAVIENAQRWVDQRVPYSQTRWYRGYRQDCSGFVSMAWNIHMSYPTGMMNRIAKPIPKEALLPGDILLNNSGTGSHVVLFERWSGPGMRYYIGYEQLSSANRPVRRLIPYPYFRRKNLYRPYRFTSFPPPKPLPKPSPPVTAPPSPEPTIQPAAARSLAATPSLPGAAGMPPRTLVAFGLTLALAGGLAWGVTGRALRGPQA